MRTLPSGLNISNLSSFHRPRSLCIPVREHIHHWNHNDTTRRAANRSTPIVAVAPPHLLQGAPPPLAWQYFNEILQYPVSAAKVRGLATRWLLQPPSCAGAAATSGMVGEAIGPDPTAWATATQHAGTDNSCGIATTTTTLVSSPPGALTPQAGGGLLSVAAACGSGVSGSGGGAPPASSSTQLLSSRCIGGDCGSMWQSPDAIQSFFLELYRIGDTQRPGSCRLKPTSTQFRVSRGARLVFIRRDSRKNS